MSGRYSDSRSRKIIEEVCSRRGTLVITRQSKPDASPKEEDNMEPVRNECEKEAIIRRYEIRDKIELLPLFNFLV